MTAKVQINRNIAGAKLEADQAKARFASTLTALQQRLKPGALATQAWSGVKEKSGEIADDAVQAVKDRPVAATGIAAAFLLFLARHPILSAASRLVRSDDEDDNRNKRGKK